MIYIDLSEKKAEHYKTQNLLSHIKMGEKILTFGKILN